MFHDIRSRMNDLKDLKVSDIIRSGAFAKELRQQLDIEEAVQTKMIASGLTRRTTLDRDRAIVIPDHSINSEVGKIIMENVKAVMDMNTTNKITLTTILETDETK